jgi:ribose 5-phosphate isomerase A
MVGLEHLRQTAHNPSIAASMTNQSEQKQRAALAAIPLLPNRGTIGLGSGTTADLFIERLAVLVQKGRKFVGVPTSEHSRALAQSLGIPLLDEHGPWQIDVTVDGADEVSENLDVIKGGGACHLREKVINDSSRMNIIIVDESKLSRRLGKRSVVPVEVVRFGHGATADKLRRFGKVSARLHAGQPLLTDSGNLIYDIGTGEIPDPRALDIEISQIPGVVETGLFVGRVSLVIVAGADGTRELYPRLVEQ